MESNIKMELAFSIYNACMHWILYARIKTKLTIVYVGTEKNIETITPCNLIFIPMRNAFVSLNPRAFNMSGLF